MSKKLLIVESPTKAKTIGKYLGDGYEVVATVGHIRDLPKSKLGIDLDKDFEVEYEIDSEKKAVVAKLRSAAERAGEIILATDPDREGEAIAWHVEWVIEHSDQLLVGSDESSVKGKKKAVNGKLSDAEGKKIRRVTFHEITKEAVNEAIKNPREIDINLVDAQQGRRVLDRVVGYKISPVLWKKVRRNLSAGRVQSVAVRLIAEREREIEKFGVERYFGWRIKLIKSDQEFEVGWRRWQGERVWLKRSIDLFDGKYSYQKTIFDQRQEVEKTGELIGSELLVTAVEAREVKRQPLPPLTTSKLQQIAARRFGWSGKQTMRVAQRLYEQGLITYHRTDSYFISSKAVGEIRDWVEKNWGKNYLPDKPRFYKQKSKNSQEAHEAIRPTMVARLELVGGEVDGREKKLYQLIWRRTVACQMAAAVMAKTVVDFESGGGEFRAEGMMIKFDGFLRTGEGHGEEQSLPKMVVGEKIKIKEKVVEEMATRPPPRYTEASLVSSLEKQGIGRPSTYAPIISTIQLRQYVEKDEGKFRPTSLGLAVNDFLVANFGKIVSLPFTAMMEAGLDKVAAGEGSWKSMLNEFWGELAPEIARVEKEAERVKVEVEKIGEKCPECKEGDLVIRVGRFGKFISCDRFPECKYHRAFKEVAGFVCPQCGGEGVVRRTKKGRRFYGCGNYPKCKWAAWKKP